MKIAKFPDRWEQKRLALMFSENTEKNTNLVSTDAFKFFYGNIVPKKKYELTDDLIETYRKYTLVQPMDIMINGLNLNYDFVSQRIALVNQSGIITSAYICLRSITDFNVKYYSYLFKSMDSRKIFHGMGTGIRLTLSFNNLKNLALPVPPREEQDQIVRFLDWKVSEINRLIAVKKREIAVWQDAIQVFIDNAIKTVTTPQVKFNHFFNMKKGLNITKKDLVDTGIPVISYGQVHSKDNTGTEISNTLIRYVDENYLNTTPSALVKKGDFIFADTSEDLKGVGNCVYVDKDIVLFAGYHTIIASPKNGDTNKYLAYLFKSSMWRDKLRKMATGVKVFSITQKMLKNTFISLPNEAEQKRITEYLDRKTSEIITAISKINAEIQKLEELKKRLISDVVTGQIDVRNIEIPEFEYVEETADAPEEAEPDDMDEEV